MVHVEQHALCNARHSCHHTHYPNLVWPLCRTKPTRDKQCGYLASLDAKTSLFCYFASCIKHEMSTTITVIRDKSVTVSVSDSSSATLAADSIAASGVDHTHALTGHDNQRAIVDNIIVTIDANEHLADQTFFLCWHFQSKRPSGFSDSSRKTFGRKV